MAKETFYFRHDYNARNDMKVQALIHDYKSSGYGVYWCIVEILHEEENHQLPLKQMTYIAIAKQLNEDVSLIEEIIASCINNYELLVIKDGFFYSERVLDNILMRAETSARRSVAGKAGALAKQNLASAKQMLASVKQNQAKKRKGKEIKEEDINISFECFWDLYEKKVGDKVKLEKKWLALTNEERSKAVTHIPLYILSAPDKKFRKDPETYLNNRSFNDEIITSGPLTAIKTEQTQSEQEELFQKNYEYVHGHRFEAS